MEKSICWITMGASIDSLRESSLYELKNERKKTKKMRGGVAVGVKWRIVIEVALGGPFGVFDWVGT